MKKLLLITVCFLSFTCINAQTYTSGHITETRTDTMYNDSTTCSCIRYLTYNITIDSSYSGDTVYLVDTSTASLLGTYINYSGISPWTFTLSSNILSQPDWRLTGNFMYFLGGVRKIVSGLDTLLEVVNTDSLYVTNPCSYSSVSGIVYVDNNLNCIFDSGDIGIYPPPISMIESLSSPVGSINNCGGWYSTNGMYSLGIQQSWLINYTVFIPPYYAFIFPYSPCFSGSYTFTTVPQTGVDFPLQCTSNVDVQCYALSPASVRLHKPFYMQPYINNTGCDSISGQLTFIKDSRLIYDSSLSSNPADIVHGDTLIWNYNNLTNLSNGAYWNSFFSNIYLTPDSTTVSIGDTLCFRIYSNIPPTDINPLNNDYSFCIPVVYSYDPNTKEVSPKGTGSQGYIPAGHDTLTYSLHFQNTGSDLAENISIIDTLDSHINASSLKILGTSHNMSPQWLASGVIQFNFNEINLPDSSSNEAASHGEVRFCVALNNHLPYGSPIKNKGYIYFDSNPPIITNITLNTIAVPNRIDQEATNGGFSVYPNPATTELIITAQDNITSISISNLLGQVGYIHEFNAQHVLVDIADLPTGVYFVKINGAEVIKFVKE